MKICRRSARPIGLLAWFAAFCLLLNGCRGTGTPAMPVVEPATPTPAPSHTPPPTSTATLTATATPTSTSTPTRTATPNRAATKEARQTATQAAADETVREALTALGIEPGNGRAAWVMTSPEELDGSGWSMGWFRPIAQLGVLRDFVIQSEVTWDTSGGLSGCAFVFRGPDDWDVETSDFYTLMWMRLQHDPRWFISYFKDGRWEYDLPGYQGVSSANIEDDKMSKNVVTLEARGDTFTVYINGIKERSIQNNKVAEGRLAFEVVQNSGTSYCKFQNAWVWVFDEE
jgi:hypothetical protein